MDSGQWAVGSGQWAVDSGQWTVDSGQLTVKVVIEPSTPRSYSRTTIVNPFTFNKSNSDLSHSLIYPFVGARIARPVHDGSA